MKDARYAQLADVLIGYSLHVQTDECVLLDAEVKDFGRADLYKISLTKGKSKKVIYATANHRWFRRPYRHGEERSKYANVECTTIDLVTGDKLVSTYGQSVKGIDGISDYGHFRTDDAIVAGGARAGRVVGR